MPKRRFLGALMAAAAVGGCSTVAKLPETVAAQAARLQAPSAAPKSDAGLEAVPLDVKGSKKLYLTMIADMRTRGRPWAALAHLDEFDRLYGRDAQAAVLRGDALLDVEDLAGAEAAYRGQLKGAEAAPAYRGLGRIASRRQDWPEAAKMFAEAVRRAPTTPNYVSDLGYALLKSGDRQGAVFRLRQAHDLAPEDPVIRNNLILALNALGDEAAVKEATARLSAEDRKAVAAMIAAEGP